MCMYMYILLLLVKCNAYLNYVLIEWCDNNMNEYNECSFCA